MTSFLCIGKGTTNYSLNWTEDSLSTASNLAVTIAVDNSHCSVAIKGIELAIIQSHNQQDAGLKEKTLFTRVIAGVAAGEKKTVNLLLFRKIRLLWSRWSCQK